MITHVFRAIATSMIQTKHAFVLLVFLGLPVNIVRYIYVLLGNFLLNLSYLNDLKVTLY